MLKFLQRGRSEVDRVLDGYELPSFPGPVMSVLGKLRDPEMSLQDIIVDLEIDPGLHVKVLRTVNSVAFGLSHKVSSLRHAASLLGRSRLESLVLGVGVKDGLDRMVLPAWFDKHSFWLSAARRAALARGLTEIFHPQSQAEAFTIGLLQDMGVPVMAALKRDIYRDLYQGWQQDEHMADLADLETSAFNLAHPELGAGIAARWEFPGLLINHVGAHHARFDKGCDIAIHIASRITDRAAPVDVGSFAACVSHDTGIDRNLMENLMARVEEEAAELAGVLGANSAF